MGKTLGEGVMKIFVLLAFAQALNSLYCVAPLPTPEKPKLVHSQIVSSPEEAAIVVYQRTHPQETSYVTEQVSYILKEIDTESVIVRNVPIPKLTFTDSTEKPKTAADVIDDTVSLKPSYKLYRNGFLIFSTD